MTPLPAAQDRGQREEGAEAAPLGHQLPRPRRASAQHPRGSNQEHAGMPEGQQLEAVGRVVALVSHGCAPP